MSSSGIQTSPPWWGGSSRKSQYQSYQFKFLHGGFSSWVKDRVSLMGWHLEKTLIGICILSVERLAVDEAKPYRWSEPRRLPWSQEGRFLYKVTKVGGECRKGEGIFLSVLTRCWHFIPGLKCQKKLFHLHQLNHKPTWVQHSQAPQKATSVKSRSKTAAFSGAIATPATGQTSQTSTSR